LKSTGFGCITAAGDLQRIDGGFAMSRTWLVAALGAVLGLGIAASSAAAAVPRSSSFDANWRFVLVNPNAAADPTGAYENAYQPGSDDSGWRRVNLPHDWSIERLPTTENTTSGIGYFQGGLGWYRKTFTLPRALTGKRISLEFDGVYMDSDVYFNGQLLTNHPYGYTGFNVDLTALAHTDGHTPNVVAVKVRNQVPSSRWYSGSGIYRNVHLIVTNPVHVARHGVFVTTPNLATTYRQGFANVHAQTDVVDDAGGAPPVKVVSIVRDARGRRVARTGTRVQTGATAVSDVRVAHPRLWSPEQPNLYTLVTRVKAGGRLLDRTTTTFGMRWFKFDPDGGFSLDGHYMKLHGVDLHHDQGALGAAINYDAVLRQMRIMKSMGVNALRTSHNPPSPEMIVVCERLGILMMDEAFDTWRTPKVAFDYGRFFDANSDADVKGMVNEAKNSPSVILWSIGNEIPDSTKPEGVPMARRLIDDVRSIDTTRPIVMGSDKYRSLPQPGSPQDQILRMLDGLGLNYNTAASVDALHAAYPDKFFFESESSSETSTRGAYQDPDQLNTGENYTPGKRATSSYDNNLASWTMSGEYGLKKDRDRQFFVGQFLWSGMDYIGEPTPYDVFPVKTSFFGAVDTAGFPKDQYYLFKSQWTTNPMVHLVPMNWTNHERGETVQVRAYSNVRSVELFLNGRSLGVKRFDRKTTTFGAPYLETTEATHDDKTVTSGPYPGSYTSPNGSAGHLYLRWDVPFERGRLIAVARRGGRIVARDEVDSAGTPYGLRLKPDRRVVGADGRSLVYVAAEVVDRHGVVVPDAGNLIRYGASNGKIVGLDNGREEDAEGYKGTAHTAFNGKGLAIVAADTRPGLIRVTASADGLRGASATVLAVGRGGGVPITTVPAQPVVPPVPLPSGTRADASYSGAPNTVPQAMLDGNASTAWSNYYLKAATALLPPFSLAHGSEWVSVTWPSAETLSGLKADFIVDASRQLPAAIAVSYWDGRRWVPVSHPQVTWATASNQSTTIAFDAVRTTAIRLDMTSRAPNTDHGFLGISELQF
jgi:beta-galactosidase